MTPASRMAFSTERSNRITLAFLGFSQSEVCGVRDYATILAHQMRTLGYGARLFWYQTSDSSPLGLFRLGDVIRKVSEAQVVVFNYSVFAGAWHGIPISVPLLAWRLWKAPSVVVLVAHEMVYPWGRRGWRGFIHALTQRWALLPLVAASTVVVVTTKERRNWLRTRRWLPSRPVVWAPVFSNVPVRSQGSTAPRSASLTVGVFGYGHESQRRDVIVRAVSGAASRLEGVELVLIGGPGPCSTQGAAWQESARATNCPCRFTGILAPDELSRELSELGVLLFFDDAGPTSRKTTLAAALAHAVPTIALDGPNRWEEMVDSGAVELSAPNAKALESALLTVLTDCARRQRLARAGRRFYDRYMAVEVVARQLADAVVTAICEQERGDTGRYIRAGRHSTRSAGPAT